MHMRPKDFQGIVRRMLLYVVPLVLLLFWGFSSYEKNLENQALLRIRGEQEKGCIILANLLESTFSQYVSDLLVVYNSGELSDYASDSNSLHRIELEKLFVRIALKKEYVNHIRFIDKRGFEIIQVDHLLDGSAKPTSAVNMEDLRTSDLFQEGRILPSNTLYISDIQNYEDQIHATPAFFLALPVFSHDEFFGLLTIDYDACYLLSFFSAYQSSLSKDIEFGLIDHEGYWILQGEQSCSDVARSEPVLFSAEPWFETLLKEEAPTDISNGDRVYHIQPVKPRPIETLVWYPVKDRLWSIVSSFNLDQLAELDQNYILSHPEVKWVLSLLLFIISGIYVVFLQLRRVDRQQMKVSSLISDYTSNGIVVTDANKLITFCNHSFEMLSGYSQNELIKKDAEAYRVEGWSHAHQKNFGFSYSSKKRPVWVKHQSNLFVLSNLTVNEVFYDNKRLEYIIEVYGISSWNVCDYVTHSEDMQYDFNLIFSNLARAIKARAPFCCLLIQLKHKELESELSQIELTGFSVAVASFLVRMLGTKEPAYVFSPSTYLLMLRGEFSNQQIVGWANELLSTMEKPFTYLGRQFDIRSICGISLFPQSGMTCNQLVLNACLATRMVEQSNAVSTLVFNEEIHSQYIRRQAILEEIPKAFGAGQLDLHYQAQIDIPTNTIKGCEGLVRWTHPILGTIRPDEFIPLMETNNLMALLGDFVIRTAIDFLTSNKEILKKYAPQFALAINLTAEELTNTSLTNLIAIELKNNEIEAGMLSIELTERTAVENLDTAEQILKKLRSMGISIAIDDFGTGFSSLSYLLELSMDKLKIDRSFIASYPDSQAITIFKTVVLLANELGVTVIAEGVETEEQLQFLREIGCSQYQGFLFSKAVEEKVFLEQLVAQNSKGV